MIKIFLDNHLKKITIKNILNFKFRNAIAGAKVQVSQDDQTGLQKSKPLKKSVNFSQSESDLRGEKTANFKRKASLFPTALDMPVERGYDKYGRKQSVVELTKKVYNLQKSAVIKNAAVPISTRRLSVAVKGNLESKFKKKLIKLS